MQQNDESASRKNENERLPGEGTLIYRKRLLPSYKAGRKERAQQRRELLAERKAIREWNRVFDRC
jgi:hypothetical protein